KAVFDRPIADAADYPWDGAGDGAAGDSRLWRRRLDAFCLADGCRRLSVETHRARARSVAVEEGPQLPGSGGGGGDRRPAETTPLVVCRPFRCDSAFG